MTIYFLFGKTGSGKSYIGNLLEKQGISHINGDQFITDEMKDCLDNKRQITANMIGPFVKILIQRVNSHKLKMPQQSFIVSQAMYLDRYRQQLLNAIPEIKFILIDVPDVVRLARVRSRHQNQKSKVSLKCAIKMDKSFEPPSHPYTPFQNHQKSNTAILKKIRTMMPEFFSEEHCRQAILQC